MRRTFMMAALLAAPAMAQAPQDPINLTAFANGALVEEVSSSYDATWQAKWITDENPQTGWATAQNAPLPVEIVISLPEPSVIHALEFDTASADALDRGAKDIEITVSSVSAKEGFTPLTAVSLKAATDDQRFDLSQPSAPIRFIKLTVTSTHGSSEYAELMEFRALGQQMSQTPLPDNLSGTYEASNYGTFHLLQEGAQLTGCYEHDGGLVSGGVEGGLMRLTWTETDGTSGPAVMVLSRDGTRFEGWWAEAETPTTWNANWDLKKVSDKVGSCAHWEPKNARGGAVGSQLAAEGRVRLYGINFDVDRDVLRPDAAPTIAALVEVMQANRDWTLAIEGHTDSTGAAQHNLSLSQRRADAVKAALVAAGIDPARLTTAGFGDARPVASNDTEIGRAQNRRVEAARP